MTTIQEIPVESLLDQVMKKKKAGMRLSQACAAYIKGEAGKDPTDSSGPQGRFELSYSFADDETYDYEVLRVVIDPDTPVSSITEIIPQAVFYENEMKELFGVKIQMISVDYQNRLYRIREEAPFGPEAGRGKED